MVSVNTRQPDVRALCASRWFVPLLALLHREKGARHAVLLKRLGLSRSMLKRVLDAATEAGWVAPNPGHGHPLRPEYVLTAEGEKAGAWCARLRAEQERMGISEGDFGRWAVPLALAMERRWSRFSALRSALDPITPRALSSGLKQLIAAGFAERRLEDAFPPLPLYRLTPKGRRLAEAAQSSPWPAAR